MTVFLSLNCPALQKMILCSGIQNAFDGEGSKTVIPRNVIGKFSIRIVPNMKPEQVKKLVLAYLEKLHKESGSPNIMK